MSYRNVRRFTLSASNPVLEVDLTENDTLRLRLVTEGAVKSDSSPDEGAFTLSITEARAKKTDASSADPPWISLGTEFMCGFRPDVGVVPETAILNRTERLGVDVIRIVLDPIHLAAGSMVFFWLVEECALDPDRS